MIRHRRWVATTAAAVNQAQQQHSILLRVHGKMRATKILMPVHQRQKLSTLLRTSSRAHAHQEVRPNTTQYNVIQLLSEIRSTNEIVLLSILIFLASFSALGVLVCFGGASLSLSTQPGHDGSRKKLVPPIPMPYPKTLADLMVAERVWAEQLAQKALEEAEVRERKEQLKHCLALPCLALVSPLLHLSLLFRRAHSQLSRLRSPPRVSGDALAGKEGQGRVKEGVGQDRQQTGLCSRLGVIQAMCLTRLMGAVWAAT